MKKNKWVAVAGISALVIAAATALGVNIDEIRSTSSEVIQFENYSGPHAIIESADAITDIGRKLGRQIATNVNKSATYGNNAKYTVIHSVSDGEPNKLDADIILINDTASVDHITNLRRISWAILPPPTDTRLRTHPQSPRSSPCTMRFTDRTSTFSRQNTSHR